MSSSGSAPPQAEGRPSRLWVLPLALLILGLFGLLLWMAFGTGFGTSFGRSVEPEAGAPERGVAATDALPAASDANPATAGREGVAAATAAAAQSGGDGSATKTATGAEVLRVELLETRPHDPEAFTQGLQLVDGVLYESTGLNGRSSVRHVDPESGEVGLRHELDEVHFGEGLALAGDRLWQLTWQSGKAFVYDRDTLEPLAAHDYAGEGWGLCHDGRRLVMSDGGAELAFRDPETFRETGRVRVTLDGQPIGNLNELECVGDEVWANVWQTPRILRIDPASGRVTGIADLSPLVEDARRAAGSAPIDVLNGIAYDEAAGTFLVTGKLWPRLYEVRFLPAEGGS